MHFDPFVIFLRNCEPVLIDSDDYEMIKAYKWFRETNGYAVREVNENGKRKVIKMHRQIMGFPEGLVIDHINGDLLDNRKSNLRACTHKQNIRNSKKPNIKNAASKYKGVSYSKRDKLYIARIKHEGKHVAAYFKSEVEAAKKYDEMAIRYFGEYARINFPSEHDIEVQE